MSISTHSRLERLAFSGKDEDFQAFSERFAAKMHVPLLRDCLRTSWSCLLSGRKRPRLKQLSKIKPNKKSRGRCSWFGVGWCSVWTRARSTSSDWARQMDWQRGGNLWGNTVALRDVAFRHSWPSLPPCERQACLQPTKTLWLFSTLECKNSSMIYSSISSTSLTRDAVLVQMWLEQRWTTQTGGRERHNSSAKPTKLAPARGARTKATLRKTAKL